MPLAAPISSANTPDDLRLTVGLTSYRPESLPHALEAMQGFEAVVLEEPPHPDFADMLAGRLSIPDYLERTDMEFPVFAAGQCENWRVLNARGVTLKQIDPFLEELIAIHEFFAGGGEPSGLPARGLRAEVYAVEKRWTKALVDYYAVAVRDDFAAVVGAAMEFARRDAAKGAFRDELRAAAIVRECAGLGNVFVEAGYLHLGLVSRLARKKSANGPLRQPIRTVWLMEDETRRLTGARHILGPGDLLTLRFQADPTYGERAGRQAAELLAARAVIRVKIELKEESQDFGLPHLSDEAACTALVSQLEYADCANLWPVIRKASTERARAAVESYLKRRRLDA